MVQDTGFSEWLPTGAGVVAVSTLDEAVAGIEAIKANYQFHCKAARSIAEEYFDARVVLAELLDQVTSGTSLPVSPTGRRDVGATVDALIRPSQ